MTDLIVDVSWQMLDQAVHPDMCRVMCEEGGRSYVRL